MARECMEDVLEAVTCLLAHGVEMCVSGVRLRPIDQGFEVRICKPGATDELVRTTALADDAARYLLTKLSI